MKYPDWAPPSLVEMHIEGLNEPAEYLGLEEQLSRILEEDKLAGRVSKGKGNIRAKLYRSNLRLPQEQRTKLLGKLITDINMKKAWQAISTRKSNDNDFFHFVLACNQGVMGWRGDQKLTKAEHKKYYQKINNLASGLSELMSNAALFHQYLPYKLNNKAASWLFSALNQGHDLDNNEDYNASYTNFLLRQVLPDLQSLLGDIAKKATQFSCEQPTVLKPNSKSEDPAAQYFIRSLSKYLKNKYGLPLHEVVAATAGVVFEQSFENDTIRRLVSML